MTSAKGAFGAEFKVGEVVYFISSKTEQVIPALVAEKITRSSLGGVRVTYVLKVKSGNSSKEIEVDPEKTQLFESTAEVKDFMMHRTALAIDKLIAAAEAVAQSFRPQKPVEQPAAPTDVNLDTINPDDPAEVVLPDGTVAKLRM